MKAAVLKAFGSPLSIETLPDPVLGTGEIIVDIAAAAVASYADRVFSGSRKYMLEPPVAPGAGGVGRVRATGPDATKLLPGDWVYCDPTIRSRDDAINPDTMLQGWTARTPSALPLHRYFHHGSFAEQMLVPTENATPIGNIETADAGRWCALSQLLVPFGGLLAGDLRVGETVLLNGATGGFGSAGVAVALALGAANVLATGRSKSKLDDLVRRFGPRVKPVQMSGDAAIDRLSINEYAQAPIDLMLDLLPREASPSQVVTAAMAVRPRGRIVLMGGVRTVDGNGLNLPYEWFMHNEITLRGQWMYPRMVIPRMVAMVRAGMIDLAQFDLVEFGLEHANDAVAYAAANAGPLQLTVLRPERTNQDVSRLIR